jgi:2-keto-4-pentenoate hydratase
MDDADRLAAAFAGEECLTALTSPPRDVAAAYDLQDAVRAAIGKPVVGWKLAQSTPAAQAAAGIDAPTVSPLLDGMIVPGDSVFAPGRFHRPEAEAEIAIELSEAIEGPVTAGEVRAAAAGFRLAIEIADTRYADKPAMGVPAVIADMNSCGALVIGPLEDMDGLHAATTASVITRLGDGSIVSTLPAEARPDPLATVAFLSRFVTQRGHTLPAGTIVTTGTHTPPTATGPGLVVVEFDGIGRVSARLSEPQA